MRTKAMRFAMAFGALVAAILLRWALDPLMGPTLPFITLFGAVAIAVWLDDYRLGALIATIGYLACAYLFIEPRGTLGFADQRSLVGLLAYLVTCAIIIGFGEALRKAQRRAEVGRETLRVTLASMGDAVITTDNSGRITTLNGVAESLTGWTASQAAGQPLDSVFRIVNEDSRLTVESPAARSLREGVVVGLANHTVLIRKDNSELPIDDSAAPIRDVDDQIVGCVLIFRDISERRRLERAAAQRLVDARFLASIVESSDDAIISKSLDGTIQSWNASAETLFGHTASDAIGRHISLVIPTDRLHEEDQIIAKLRAGERIEHFETVRKRGDGRLIDVSLTISPILDDKGNVIGASKIVRNITERKRAETDRLRLVSLVENSTDFIGICDMQFVPLFVNRAGLKLVGLDDLQHACRTPVQDFFFPEDRARILDEFFPKVLEQGDGEIEVRFRHFKTGDAIWMLYRVVLLNDANGERIGLATVSRDITQRREMEDDLRHLAAELSEASHRKDEFLAMLAHELRNPLAPVLNGLQVLQMKENDDVQVRSACEMMERQVRQMVRLIDDLLDVSRITRGKIELKRDRVELASVIEHAVEAVRPLRESMHHELTVSLPQEPIRVDGDPTRLTQIVGNLLTNACKFTERGGKIQVTLLRDGDQAVIRVKDNGLGIAPEQLPRIFEMFTQLDTTLERSQGGLGIGLSLSKNLVQLHGGTLEAQSEGLARGAEFVVRLPLATDAASEKAKSPDTRPEQNNGGHRILVVDDNRDSANSLAMLLKLGGHEVHTAHDGVEAVQKSESLKPDAVLLDIGLPKLNGYEAGRKIREQPWGKNIAMIALTGWGHENDRRKSREAGFNGHLVKPVDHATLIKLLDDLLEPNDRREG